MPAGTAACAWTRSPLSRHQSLEDGGTMCSLIHRSRLVATPLLIVLATWGCRERGVVPRQVAAPVPRAAVSLQIDYAGAEAMVAALERDTITDAAVDSLLNIHGVSMMVDNVVRLVPGVERADFGTALQRFLGTGDVAQEHLHFNLPKAHGERERIRTLLAHLRENEQAVLDRMLAIMGPYTPETGPLHLKAYLMAGGTSTGFVRTTPEGDVFYYNLADAAGDWEGVMAHITHETFHLVQKAAFRHVPSLAAMADSAESLPLPERTLATVVGEGTADLVSDPARFGGGGPEIARMRARFRTDAEPARVRANFALFDTTFQQVARNEITWREVLDRGFMSNPRFYALGFQMAKAVERHCGPERIRRLLQQRPVEFFLQYISLYREHPEIVGHFAPETERYLMSLR
ncbi:DUF5700 domain-containing putative Zn-dependent protease [Longimicrobium sp.]|uniref:DUF5700 domain-containing putative Zn-dependent protease n=1 Tax=Longimicrobium sp. TaxID=2029185 RepID=UPI002ED7D58F